MNHATAATPNLRGKYILSSLRNTKHQQANPTSQHQSSRKTHISAIAKTPHTDPTTTKRAPNLTKTNRKDEGKNPDPNFPESDRPKAVATGHQLHSLPNKISS